MGSRGRFVISGINKMLDFYSQFMPTPLSIQHFLEFGLDANEHKSFLFLRKELPVRLSNIMKEIHLLPEHLLRTPSVVAVNNWYVQSFDEIIEFEKAPITDQTLLRFCETLVRVRNRHADVVPTMAQGVIELKESHRVDQQTENSIQYFLDRFYMSRISIRMLINQHTLLFGAKVEGELSSESRHIGALDPCCDVKKVVIDAYENAKFLCDQYYMSSPDLVFQLADSQKGEETIQIVYVPSHLYHMLFELFKNAMRAVMEHHGNSSEELPPVRVTIVKGKEDVCVKLSDRGGGIPRSDTQHLFKYMYSTAPQPSSSDIHSAPLAGYGYGLPISRLYARYFHGNLALLSCDGYGTDAIIYLKVLLNEANEYLPVFNKKSSRTYKATIPTNDWSDQSSSTSKFPHSARKSGTSASTNITPPHISSERLIQYIHCHSSHNVISTCLEQMKKLLYGAVKKTNF